MHLYSLAAFACLTTAGNSILPSAKVDGIDFGRLQKPVIHQPEVFKQAIQIITSLENAPSCHRLATRSLLESCQSLADAKSPDSYIVLDQVKSLFAARLAACELNGAKAAVPIQCLVMIPKPVTEERVIRCLLPGSNCGPAHESIGRREFRFEKLTQRQVDNCLSTLESRPQWWTSYSNARQNAVVICHAARNEAEREELLEIHKEMTKVSSDLTRTISQTSEQSAEHLKAQLAFAEHVRKLQADAVEDVKAGRVEVKGLLRAMAGQVETFLNDVLVRFKSSTMQAAASMDDMDSRIRESTDEVVTVQHAIKDSMDAIASKHEALARSHHETSELTHSSAVALQNSLSTMRSQQIQPIEMALKGLHTLIEAQTQLMQLMYEKQGSMDGRLAHFNNTIHSLQIRATIAEDTLSGLFENLTSQMLVTNDLASSIKTNLEEAGQTLATSILTFFNPFKRVLSGWPAFPVTVAIIAYLVYGAQVARRVALIGLASYAFMFLYEALQSFEIRWAASNYSTTDLIWFLLIQERTTRIYIILIVTLLGISVIFCIAKRRFRSPRQNLERDQLFSDILHTEKKCSAKSPLLPNYSI